MAAQRREPDRNQSSSPSTESGSRGRQSNEAGVRTSGDSGRESGRSGAIEDRERSVPTSREVRTPGRGGTMRQRPLGLTPFGTASGPFAVMQQLQDEMDQLLQEFGIAPVAPLSRDAASRRGTRTGGALQPATRQGWTPEVDIFRRGDALIVRADLPGIDREDVSVDLEEGVLTIRGERRHEAEEDREGYYWSERSFGSFQRSIPLPEGVDEERAEAKFKDGVLEVTMPAPKEDPQRRRSIEVR